MKPTTDKKYSTFSNKAQTKELKDDEEIESLLPSTRIDALKSSEKAENNITQYHFTGAMLIVAMIVMLATYYFLTSSPSTVSLTASKSSQATKSESSSAKPNFVFILADDLGYESIGYEQHDFEGVAPYLSNMMKNGIYIENYYTMEVCSPSRASLMTGRLPLTIGMQYKLVTTAIPWGVNEKEVFLPEVLRDYGNYKNYAIGKWHLGHYKSSLLPTARGFHEYMGYLDGENFYWSKRCNSYPQFVDFLHMNESCYYPYEE